MPQPLFFEDRGGNHSESDDDADDTNTPPIEHDITKPPPQTPPAAQNTPNAGEQRLEESDATAADAPPAHPHPVARDDDDDDAAPALPPVRVGVPSASAPARQPAARRKAVWVDDDDERHHPVDLHTVKRRRKLRKALGETHVSAGEYAARVRDLFAASSPAAAGPRASWAELPSQRKEREARQLRDDPPSDDGHDDSEDDAARPPDVQSLLRSSAKLLSSRKRAPREGLASQDFVPLKPGILALRRVENANREDPSHAEARCVDFHPTGRLLLTAGLDKTVRVFNVDGKDNAKVQGIHMRNFPIHCAKFTGGGTQVVVTGRRRYFHQLDMNSGTVSTLHTLSTHEERAWEKFEVSADGSKLAFLGQQGKIVLVSNKTKREIGQLRLNGRVACVAFAPEGANENHIYASSQDGTVYLWDARRMDCIDRHNDEGAIHSTSLAASAAHYALGSDSGVVNVYSSAAMHTSHQRTIFGTRTEKPKKSFFNLTTTIDNATFNHDGKLLAFSSHDKKDAVKIAHIPSMTVFSNWPTARANLRRVCSLQFSPKGGYLAIGNDKGDVQLMRLSSYPAA